MVARRLVFIACSQLLPLRKHARGPGMASLCLVLTICCSVRATDGDREVLGVIAEGYAANVESFSHFGCEFTSIDFQSRTVTDGIAGKFSETYGPRIYGKWVRDGIRQTYVIASPEGEKQLASPQVLGTGPVSGSVRVRGFAGIRLVTDGRYAATTPNPKNLITLHDKEKGSQPTAQILTQWNPLYVGHKLPPEDPATLLRQCLSAKLYGRFVGNQELNRRATMAVEVGESAGKVKFRYWFDPDRGFLPIVFEVLSLQNQAVVARTFITDFITTDSGHYFPKRSVRFRNPDASDGPPRSGREIIVTKFDDRVVPDKTEFAVVIGRGCQVNRNPHDQGVFAADHAMVVTPWDLADLAQKLDSAAEHWEHVIADSKAQAAAEKAQLAAGAHAKWCYISFGAAFLACGFYGIWRRTRPTRKN